MTFSKRWIVFFNSSLQDAVISQTGSALIVYMVIKAWGQESLGVMKMRCSWSWSCGDIFHGGCYWLYASEKQTFVWLLPTETCFYYIFCSTDTPVMLHNGATIVLQCHRTNTDSIQTRKVQLSFFSCSIHFIKIPAVFPAFACQCDTNSWTIRLLSQFLCLIMALNKLHSAYSGTLGQKSFQVTIKQVRRNPFHILVCRSTITVWIHTILLLFCSKSASENFFFNLLNICCLLFFCCLY